MQKLPFISNFFSTFTYKKSKFRIALEILIYVCFFVISFLTCSLNHIYPYNLVNIAFYAMLSLLIVIWVVKYSHFVLNYYFVFLVFFNLAIVVTSLLNGTFYINTTVLTLSITTFLFSQFLVEKEQRKFAIVMFFSAFIVFVIYFTIFYFPEIIKYEGQAVGLDFTDPNILGYIFVYGLCISLYFTLFKQLYALIIIDCYILYLILLTGSRSALIIGCLALSLFIVLFFGKEGIWKSVILIGTSFVLLLIVLSLPTFSVLKDRLLSALESVFGSYSDGDWSSKHRLLMVSYGIEFIAKRLATGYGGIYNFSYYNFSGQISHNNFIEVAFNYGFFTLLVYEAFIVYSIYRLSIHNNNEKILHIASLLSFFFVQFFYPNFTNKIDFLMIAIAMSFLYNSSTVYELDIRKIYRRIFNKKNKFAPTSQ